MMNRKSTCNKCKTVTYFDKDSIRERTVQEDGKEIKEYYTTCSCCGNMRVVAIKL